MEHNDICPDCGSEDHGAGTLEKLAEALAEDIIDRSSREALINMHVAPLHPAEIGTLGACHALAKLVQLTKIHNCPWSEVREPGPHAARDQITSTMEFLSKLFTEAYRTVNGGIGSVNLTAVVRDG